MPSISLYGYTLNTDDYSLSMIKNNDGSSLDASWSVDISTEVVENGIDININMTNNSLNSKLCPKINIKMPFNNSSVKPFYTTSSQNGSSKDGLQKDTRFRRKEIFNDSESVPNIWGVAFNSDIPPNAYGRGLFIPVLCNDNGNQSGKGTVGISTNFFHSFKMLGKFDNEGNGYYEFDGSPFISSFSSSGLTPGFFEPQETRSWSFWIRLAPGVGVDSAIETAQPYINWFRSNYTYGVNHQYKHYPKLDGRIWAFPMSQSEQLVVIDTIINERKYWSFDPTNNVKRSQNETFTEPYVHPEYASGWKEYLNAVCDPKVLLENNYKYIGLIAPSGYSSLPASAPNFLPAVFTKLPPNLKNTIHEIKEWENENGIKVIFWAGLTGRVQLNESAWNGPVLNLAKNTILRNEFNSNSRKQYIDKNSPEYQAFIDNFDNGCFKFLFGAGLDAAPYTAANPWALDLYKKWRNDFPNAFFAMENMVNDVSLIYGPPFYFREIQFGGICPLLNKLIPEYQPIIGINKVVDTGNSQQVFEDRIEEIESQGGIPWAISSFQSISKRKSVIPPIVNNSDNNNKKKIAKSDKDEFSLDQDGNNKFLKVISKSIGDKIDGFNKSFIEKYGFSVGLGMENNYSDSEKEIILNSLKESNVYAKANVVNGTISFNNDLGKFNNIKISVNNPRIYTDKEKSIPNYKHKDIEDFLEFQNMGLPFNLSLVHNSNLINSGIVHEKEYGNRNAEGSIYQSKFISPCVTENFYDKLNSTIDYNINLNNKNKNINIPYITSLCHIEELGEIWVGGIGGIISINTTTKEIDKVLYSEDIVIKKIKLFNNKIYILSSNDLFYYDLGDNNFYYNINKLNFPSNIFSFEISRGNTIIVGASDGIYVKRNSSNEWVKAISSDSNVLLSLSTDNIYFINKNNNLFFSTNALDWEKSEINFNLESITQTKDLIISSIIKHRSQILLGSSNGLLLTNFYSQSKNASLIDIFNDIDKSYNLYINDLYSSFDDLIIGLSNGNVLKMNGTEIETDIDTIHKVIKINNERWVFGFNKFQVIDEDDNSGRVFILSSGRKV